MSDGTTLTGGCACGAVRYRLAGEPDWSILCQCRDCQRASGAGHAALLVVKQAAAEVEGELRFHDVTSDKGNQVSRGFCPACGTPICGRSSGHPDSLFITAGSLDEPSRFSPGAVSHRASAQPWDHVDPGLE